jgi:hypothetical protein
MQEMTLNVPCTGKFDLRVRNERWEVDIHTKEGTTFFLDGAALQNEVLPIMDLNTGQVLNIPEFMWRMVNDHLMDMLSFERKDAIIPEELSMEIN